MRISANSTQRLRAGLAPHLPEQASNQGATANTLAAECQNYVDSVGAGQTPTLDPYGPDLSQQETVELSNGLQRLARGCQQDFQAKVPGAQLRLPQLLTATDTLQAETEADIEQLESSKSELKRGYYWQVGKTTAWMGATAASLLAGGIFPNPVTVLAVAGTSIMTIRSIGKARTMQRELAQRIPELDTNLAVSRQLLADTNFYAPHLRAWDSLLEEPPADGKAA